MVPSVQPQNIFKRYHTVIEYIIAFILFLLLVGILFNNVLRLPPGYMVFGQDNHSFLYFMVDFIKKSLQKGVMPWWNPYIFSGVPMIASPAFGSVFYPGNVVFLILPYHQAIVLYYVLHIVGSGMSMFWFCRKYLGFISSLAAGVVLMLSGYMIGALHMGHIETVAVMTWLPLILGSLMRLVESKQRKYFLLFVGSLALQILAGTYVAVLFTIELILLYNAFILVSREFAPRTVRTILVVGGSIVLGIVLAFGLGTIELLPFLENTIHSIRSARFPFETTARDAFNWHLWYILVQNLTGNTEIILDPQTQKVLDANAIYEFLLYIGKAATLVCGIGLVLELVKWKKTGKLNPVWIFLVIACIFFILLSLGKNLGVYRVLYDIFPPYQVIRRPIRHFFIVTFCLAFLTGWGVQKLKFRAVQVIVIVLVSAELLAYGRSHIRFIAEPYLFNTPGLISYLTKHMGNNRLYYNFYNVGKSGSLPYENAGMYYHIPMVGGYSPMLLERYIKFVFAGSTINNILPIARTAPIKLDSPVLNYLGTRFVLDEKLWQEDRHDKQIPDYFRKVYEDDLAILYENPKASPRFFLVSSIASAKSDLAILGTLEKSEFDLASAVFLTNDEAQVAGRQFAQYQGKPCGPTQSAGSVSVKHYAENGFVLETHANCTATLVTSEPYYPGWAARIDGKQAPILMANFAFRALVVPQGVHKVEMYYDPKIFLYGVLVSSTSLIILLILLRRWERIKVYFMI